MNDSITIRKTRELGEILSDGFLFLRYNLKYFYKPILIISIIWSALYATALYNGFIDLSGSTALVNINPSQFFLKIGSLVLFSLIVGYTLYLILLNYISFKINNSEGQPEINDLLKNFIPTFFRLFLYGIISTFIFIGLCLLFLIPGIWFMVIFINFFQVTFFENKPFGPTLSRSRFLVKDNWWNTFLAFLVPVLLVDLILIPFAFILQFSVLKDIMVGGKPSLHYGLGASIGYFFYYLLNNFLLLYPITCTVLQYFNLVEKKDNLGMLRQLDTLGSNTLNPGILGPEEY